MSNNSSTSDAGRTIYEQLVIVLGKRLYDDQLTLEGISRVDALIKYVLENDCSKTIIAFCGGTTGNQVVSESQAMYQYFCQRLPKYEMVRLGKVLLEDKSTNTIENIQHLSQVVINSGLILPGSSIPVRLISNDYHLSRLIDIQTYLDEQGLLKLLVTRCQVHGLTVLISYDINHHVAVPYPYQTPQGLAFLAVDELTTYRVYLEGVMNHVFERPLTDVREMPLKIARKALSHLKQYGRHHNDKLVLMSIEILNSAIKSTPPECSSHILRHNLAQLDTALTMLNRYLDPENDVKR
ncbi:YdcF family protein [Vibrio cionasavignyae]|uniref:YdcF family protein n=1 Tax=Vibrio cionasavignyae TaxID=2910252 RepID=UPI003D095AA3